MFAISENTYTAGPNPTPRQAVNWWMTHLGPDGTLATNGHRKNILDPKRTELGVGVVLGSADVNRYAQSGTLRAGLRRLHQLLTRRVVTRQVCHPRRFGRVLAGSMTGHGGVLRNTSTCWTQFARPLAERARSRVAGGRLHRVHRGVFAVGL